MIPSRRIAALVALLCCATSVAAAAADQGRPAESRRVAPTRPGTAASGAGSRPQAGAAVAEGALAGLAGHVFVPVPPCRVIDTRSSLGGRLNAGVTRHFLIAGTGTLVNQGGSSSGCGIPLGSTAPKAVAIALNLVAVQPDGPGNLRAWAYGESVPNASVLNYANVPGLNIANGVIVPITGVNTASFDLSIRADVSGTHVVGDVTGYFAPTGHELVELWRDTGLSLDLGGCEDLLQCVITVQRDSLVVVHGQVDVTLAHSSGTADTVVATLSAGPAACSAQDPEATRFHLPASLPSEAAWTADLPVEIVFSQQGGTTMVNTLAARMSAGASSGDLASKSYLSCLALSK